MSPSLAALVSATMRGVMNPVTASSHHHLLLHPPTPSTQHHGSMSQQSQSQSQRRRLSEKPNLGSNSGKLSVVVDVRRAIVMILLIYFLYVFYT
jgi:hypothetical protein